MPTLASPESSMNAFERHFHPTMATTPYLRLRQLEWAEQLAQGRFDQAGASVTARRLLSCWQSQLSASSEPPQTFIARLLSDCGAISLTPQAFRREVVLALGGICAERLPDATVIASEAFLEMASGLHAASLVMQEAGLRATRDASTIASEMERASGEVVAEPSHYSHLREAIERFLRDMAELAIPTNRPEAAYRIAYSFQRRLVCDFNLPPSQWQLLLLKLRQHLRNLAAEGLPEDLNEVFEILMAATPRFELIRTVFDSLRAKEDATPEQSLLLATVIALEAKPEASVVAGIYRGLDAGSLAAMARLSHDTSRQPWFLRLRQHFERAQLDWLEAALNRIQRLSELPSDWQQLRSALGSDWGRLSGDLAQGLSGEGRVARLNAMIEELAWRALATVRAGSSANQARLNFVHEVVVEMGFDPVDECWRKAPQIAASLSHQLREHAPESDVPWLPGLFDAVSDRLRLARETPVKWAMDLQPTEEAIAGDCQTEGAGLALAHALRQVAIKLWQHGEQRAFQGWRSWLNQTLRVSVPELCQARLRPSWEMLWEEAVSSAERQKLSPIATLLGQLRQGQSEMFGVAELRLQAEKVAEAASAEVFRRLPDYAKQVGNEGKQACVHDNTLTLLELCAILENGAEDPVLALVEWWNSVVGSYLVTRPKGLFEANLEGMFHALCAHLREDDARYLFRYIEGAYRENLGVECLAARRPQARMVTRAWANRLLRQAAPELARALSLPSNALRGAVVEALDTSELAPLTGATANLLEQFQRALWRMGDPWLAAHDCGGALAAARKVAGTESLIHALRRCEAYLLRHYFGNGATPLTSAMVALTDYAAQGGLANKLSSHTGEIATLLGSLLPQRFPRYFKHLETADVSAKCARDQRLVLDHWARTLTDCAGPLTWVNGLRFYFELLLPFIAYPREVWIFLAQITERLLAPHLDAAEHLAMTAWSSRMERLADALAKYGPVCARLYRESGYTYSPKAAEEAELKDWAALILAAHALRDAQTHDRPDAGIFPAALTQRFVLTSSSAVPLSDAFQKRLTTLVGGTLGPTFATEVTTVAETLKKLAKSKDRLEAATASSVRPSIFTIHAAMHDQDDLTAKFASLLEVELVGDERPAVEHWRAFHQQFREVLPGAFAASEVPRLRALIDYQGGLLAERGDFEPWYWPALVIRFAQHAAGRDAPRRFAEAVLSWLAPIERHLYEPELAFIESNLADTLARLDPQAPERLLQRACWNQLCQAAEKLRMVRAMRKHAATLANAIAQAPENGEEATLPNWSAPALDGVTREQVWQGYLQRLVFSRLVPSCLPAKPGFDTAYTAHQTQDVPSVSVLYCRLREALGSTFEGGMVDEIGDALDHAESPNFGTPNAFAASLLQSTRPRLSVLNALDEQLPALALAGVEHAQAQLEDLDAATLQTPLTLLLEQFCLTFAESGDLVQAIRVFKRGFDASAGHEAALVLALGGIQSALCEKLEPGLAIFWHRVLGELGVAADEVRLGQFLSRHAGLMAERVADHFHEEDAAPHAKCVRDQKIVLQRLGRELRWRSGLEAALNLTTYLIETTVPHLKDDPQGLQRVWRLHEEAILHAEGDLRLGLAAGRWFGHLQTITAPLLGLRPLLQAARKIAPNTLPSLGYRGAEQQLWMGLMAAAVTPEKALQSGKALAQQVMLSASLLNHCSPQDVVRWLNQLCDAFAKEGLDLPARLQQTIFDWPESLQPLASLSESRASALGAACLVRSASPASHAIWALSRLARADAPNGLSEADAADTLAPRIAGWTPPGAEAADDAFAAWRLLRQLPTEIRQLAETKAKRGGFRFKKDPGDYRSLAKDEACLNELVQLLRQLVVDGAGARLKQIGSLAGVTASCLAQVPPHPQERAWVALIEAVRQLITGKLGEDNLLANQLATFVREIPARLLGIKLIGSESPGTPFAAFAGLYCLDLRDARHAPAYVGNGQVCPTSEAFAEAETAFWQGPGAKLRQDEQECLHSRIDPVRLRLS